MVSSLMIRVYDMRHTFRDKRTETEFSTGRIDPRVGSRKILPDFSGSDRVSF